MKCNNQRSTASLVCIITLLPAFAFGQSMASTLGGEQKNSGAADAESMIDVARTGFEARGHNLINELFASNEDDDANTDRETLNTLLAERLETLEDVIRKELQPLRLDGVLGQSEAADTIGRVTDTAWLSFQETAEAKYHGYPAPPRALEYESTGNYAWDMTKYAVLQRNQPANYAMLLGAIAAGILLAWICSLWLGKLRSYFRGRDYDVIASLIGGVRGPLYVTFALAGLSVGLDGFWLPQVAEEFLDPALQFGFIVALLWLFWTLASLAAQGLGWMLKTTYREPDQQLVAILRKSLQLAVFCIFAVVIARVVFQVTLQNVLLGVGLLGIAISLAAQDTLKNLFGSVTIVFDQPFKVGDLIEFRGFFGHVEDIGFRSTKVREFDGHLVTIPNADIVREPVQNVDARPWIRRRFRLGLRYDTPPDKVRNAIKILQDILGGRDNEPDDMGTHVVFEKFGDSNLQLLVQYCVEPGEYWDALAKGSNYHLQILDQFNEAGIEFAFPTQTTVLESTEQHPLSLESDRSRRDE